MLRIQRKFIESCLLIMLLASLFILGSTRAAAQQRQESPATQDVISKNTSLEPKQPAPPVTAVPVYKDFSGVTLGMSAADVREKLGHLKNKGERQDFFVFSESQTAQIVYDADGKAITISVDYINNDAAPTVQSVLGEAVQPKADGSIFQLKRYPEAGYWVAYSRTAGDEPTVTVTMQKI